MFITQLKLTFACGLPTVPASVTLLLLGLGVLGPQGYAGFPPLLVGVLLVVFLLSVADESHLCSHRSLTHSRLFH